MLIIWLKNEKKIWWNNELPHFWELSVFWRIAFLLIFYLIPLSLQNFAPLKFCIRGPPLKVCIIIQGFYTEPYIPANSTLLLRICTLLIKKIILRIEKAIFYHEIDIKSPNNLSKNDVTELLQPMEVDEGIKIWVLWKIFDEMLVIFVHVKSL